MLHGLLGPACACSVIAGGSTAGVRRTTRPRVGHDSAGSPPSRLYRATVGPSLTRLYHTVAGALARISALDGHTLSPSSVDTRMPLPKDTPTIGRPIAPNPGKRDDLPYR